MMIQSWRFATIIDFVSYKYKEMALYKSVYSALKA